jgi:hypothetical protein
VGVLVCPVTVAVTVTGVFAAGVVVEGVTPVMRGPSPVRRAALAAPGVEPEVAVDAAQLSGSVLSSEASTSSRDLPPPSVVVGHGSRSEYVTVSMVAPAALFKVTVSPLFLRDVVGS